MYITQHELEKDIDHYFDLSASEDIYVTRDGKISVKITKNDKNAETFTGEYPIYGSKENGVAEDILPHSDEDDAWSKKDAMRYFRKFRKERKRIMGGRGAKYVNSIPQRIEISDSLSGIIPSYDDDTVEKIISESIARE